MPASKKVTQDNYEAAIEKRISKLSLAALKLEQNVINKAVATKEADEGGYVAVHDLNQADYLRGCAIMIRLKILDVRAFCSAFSVLVFLLSLPVALYE